jgi:hypothetical protein
MPFDDPVSLDLKALFRDPEMFDSRSSWSAAGFQVINRSSSGKIMVARHPSVHGLLFKKYTSDVSQKDQIANYERRVEGADRLRSFIGKHGFSRLVVPRKWIVDLPHPLSRRGPAHVLVVEQLDLIGDEQTKEAYQTINPAVLTDLCVVLFHFRGMDSNAKNLPFTSDGRIALIDTEHWDRGSSKSYLHRIGEYLLVQQRSLAKKIFRQLKDGESVRVGDAADFSDEEDTSDSDSDFVDEEDTSSSSSSS